MLTTWIVSAALPAAAAAYNMPPFESKSLAAGPAAVQRPLAPSSGHLVGFKKKFYLFVLVSRVDLAVKTTTPNATHKRICNTSVKVL